MMSSKPNDTIRQQIEKAIMQPWFDQTFKPGWISPDHKITQIKVKKEQVKRIEALLASSDKQTEKAYGGCHICYGKGYHTKRVGYSSKLGNTTTDTIGYCTCERGQQLEQAVDASNKTARIDTLQKIYHLKTNDAAEIYREVRETLAQLQAEANNG